MLKSKSHFSLLLSLTALLLASVLSQDAEECRQTGVSSLKCTLLHSRDFPRILPQEGRDSVRWMTLYVGTFSNKHEANSQPITYPDWSQYPKLAYLFIYIHSTAASPNYAPDDMFASLNGGLNVLRMSSFAAVPINVRILGTGFDKLNSLRIKDFNISGVTGQNLGGLSASLDTLELINTDAEGDKETILLDSVFGISEALPRLVKLSLENFEFLPLLSSPELLSPLPDLEGLTLRAASGSGGLDVSVFFDNRIFPALDSLELSGFESFRISGATPPLTKLRLEPGTPRPFSLSAVSMTLRELYLTNFHLGNLTSLSLAGLRSLQRLYLTGSEDTQEVADDTFLASSQLTHLRISRMPNLLRFTERALLGLTELTYLHLGTLHSLQTLDPDTSSLRHLASLYITSNRELSRVPVRFFRPLTALETISVRSNKFDEECDCNHSYLSSLLTFSRAQPPLTLRSSCHENRRFDRCQKNHGANRCWDFEGRCPHECLPTGNLSYACVCPLDMGTLGPAGNCVDLSQCIPLTSGAKSHNCFRDSFSCVRHPSNQSISCSCYGQHALLPGGLACTSLSSCTLTGDLFLCEGAGMECTDTLCRCVAGAEWDPSRKICVRPVTTTNSPTPTTVSSTTSTPTPTTTETTTTTTTPTTTPITTTTTRPEATTPTTTTPGSVAATTSIPETTPKPVTTTSVADTTPPPDDTTTPPPVDTTTPPPVDTTTPPPVDTTTPPPVDTTTPPPVDTMPPPEYTTSPPVDITSPVDTTLPVDTTTSPVDTTTSPVDTSPPPVDTMPPPVGTTPPPVDTMPPPIGTTPPVDTTPPPEDTSPPEDTTSPPVGESTSSVEAFTRVGSRTSGPGTGATLLAQSQVQPNVALIVGYTLGAICLGGLILMLASFLIFLLVKIYLYSSGSQYKIVGTKSKHSSLRSFESSNSSTNSNSKFKELSV